MSRGFSGALGGLAVGPPHQTAIRAGGKAQSEDGGGSAECKVPRRGDGGQGVSCGAV
jgi:hypothetical protein